MEEPIEIVLEVAREEVSRAIRYALIGKIVADRALNRKGVFNVIRSIWGSRDLEDVRELGKNLYGFSFKTRKGLEFALNNGPWAIIGHHLILQRWEISKGVKEIEFKEIAFWIQVHNLPLEMQTMTNARRIGSTLGRIMDIEDPSWNLGIGRGFLRIKVAIDVNKPLVGGFWVPKENNGRLWCEIKYERFADFCYECGRMGHTEKTCGFVHESENLVKKYGSWLRAAPLRDAGRGDREWKREDEQGAEMMTPHNQARLMKEWNVEQWRFVDVEEAGNVDSSIEKEKTELSHESTNSLEEVQQNPNLPEPVRLSPKISTTTEIPETSSRPASTFVKTNIILQHLYSTVESNPSQTEIHNTNLVSENHLSKQLSISPTKNPVVTVINHEGEAEPGYKVEFPAEEDDDDKGLVEIRKDDVAEQALGVLVPVFQQMNLKRSVDHYDVDTIDGGRSKARKIDLNEMLLKVYEENEQLGNKENECVIEKQSVRWLASCSHQGYMRYLSWNCQGIGSALTVNNLHNLRRKYDPQFLFLMETKNKEKKLEVLRRKMHMEGRIYVEPEGLSGGLALWWVAGISVEVVDATKNFIDVRVEDDIQGVKCRICWVYGPPKFADRKVVWEMIKGRAKDFDGPWMMLGDFNDFLYHHEKEGGKERNPQKLQCFRNMMDTCGLFDLHYQGQRFTWLDKRESLIKERIDRAIANMQWMETFAKTQVFNLPIVGSDHSPILVDSNFCDKKVPKQFKFEIIWDEKEECEQIIRDGWSSAFQGSHSYQVVQKLKKCRRMLIAWSKKAFPNNKKVVEELMNEVATIQDKDVSVECCQKVEKLIADIKKAWDCEEKYWMQRSRVNWLQHGDNNTKFFHHNTLARMQHNKILSIKNEDGEWVENEDEILGTFQKFYEKLFTSGGSNNWRNILDNIPALVSEDMNIDLLRDVEDEEIKAAVFELGALKAPGPDGYNGWFYQRYWKIVCDSVIKAVKCFFTSGHLLKEINKTNVILIPKAKKAEDVGQFRPIACCNFLHKIIAKVMVNRLKPHMDSLITQNQSAFIAQRQIQDNILVANEAFHYLKLKKKGKKADMAIKIDMNKAYDRVEWKFLEAILHKIGFENKWVRWLMECVSSVSYNIFVNDVLSRMLNSASESGSVTANKQNCETMVAILEDYSRASGQMINLNKSRVVFSANAKPEQKEEMKSILHMEDAPHTGNYLGIPSFWGKSKRQAMAYVKEKIPKNICDEINSVMANFYWGQGDNENKIHWKGWKSLTNSKCEGGIGFGDLNTINIACLGKLVWRFVNNQDALWARILKGIYFPNSTIWDARKGARASWAWTSILEGRNFVKDNSQWLIRGGSDVHIWTDKWVLKQGKVELRDDEASIDLDWQPKMVSELIDKENVIWRTELIEDRVFERTVQAIQNMPINEEGGQDRLIWPADRNGEYSVKTGYIVKKTQEEKIMKRNPSSSHTVATKTWRIIWSMKVPRKIRSFLWRVCSNSIATNYLLWKRRIKDNPCCPFCLEFDETPEHLLLLCPWTRCVWFGTDLGYKLEKESISTFDTWLENAVSDECSHQEKEQIYIRIGYTCWCIWKERCRAVFELCEPNPGKVNDQIRRGVAESIGLIKVETVAKEIEQKCMNWEPPEDGWLKMNCDGAYNDSSIESGIGVIIRDKDASIVTGLNKTVKACSCQMAEGLAMREGLKLARRRRIPKIIVETDS
ncbi:reverse transcriptase [Corchorus capsularis]|uniref:Reverse transcriptase n=1 Tax=Corchorus capsularis TaxID=210143 RepID=A0A1R3KYI5_COCAP|nr:reverse transcriptase [Corchorus capsularis]